MNSLILWVRALASNRIELLPRFVQRKVRVAKPQCDRNGDRKSHLCEATSARASDPVRLTKRDLFLRLCLSDRSPPPFGGRDDRQSPCGTQPSLLPYGCRWRHVSCLRSGLLLGLGPWFPLGGTNPGSSSRRHSACSFRRSGTVC